MKRTPQVVPPPSKAVRDQLRGVQQIHVLPQWLGYGPYGSPYQPYGSPYQPLRIDGWHVLKVKPSMSPELLKLQDKDKPSCQQGGWNGEDWKDWNDSSGSQDCTWDKPSCQQGGWNGEDWKDWNDSSGSQDCTWNTWNSWNSKEEWVQDERYQEKDMVEDNHEDYDYIMEEPEMQEDHDESAPVFHGALKQCHPAVVEVGELRFSQKSCGKTFQCGRPVSQLVQKLIDGEVALSAPFLQLTVYEDTDSDGYPVIKCIDNRRLFALKEYAMRSGKEVMVNVEYFSQNTVKKVRRIIQNSDNTDGREVRMRRGKRTINNNKKRRRSRF